MAVGRPGSRAALGLASWGPAAVLALSRPAATAIVAARRTGPGAAAGLAARRPAALSRSWLQLRLWPAAAAV